MFAGFINAVLAFPSRVKQYFQHRPDRFLERLREQTQITVRAGDALTSYMERPGRKGAHAIRRLEKEADEVHRILVAELNRTFATPFDRKDIQVLSRSLDDVLDEFWASVNEMDILGVESNTYLNEMARLLASGAEELKLAMDRLPEHPSVASMHAIRARAVDNTIEMLYAQALADLFRKPKDLDNLVTMMKLREVYRHLFHASQRIADAANVIEDIIVKFF